MGVDSCSEEEKGRKERRCGIWREFFSFGEKSEFHWEGLCKNKQLLESHFAARCNWPNWIKISTQGKKNNKLWIGGAIKETVKSPYMFSGFLRLRGQSSSSSSSPCRTISTDLTDPLLLPFSIIHRFWSVFKATSCIGTLLLYVVASWSSCLFSSMWGSPQENVTYEFVPTFPSVSRMSVSTNLDSFRDGW